MFGVWKKLITPLFFKLNFEISFLSLVVVFLSLVCFGVCTSAASYRNQPPTNTGSCIKEPGNFCERETMDQETLDVGQRQECENDDVAATDENPVTKIEDDRREGDGKSEDVNVTEFLKSDTHDEDTFPTTLEGFGYKFNEDGELRDIKTDGPYEFFAKENDRFYNQMRYEALGEIVTEYIFNLLETECQLKKITIPFEASENEPTTFIYMSENALAEPDRLLVLVHGSGAVKSGQWSRRLIINEDIKTGSQIPYIQRALQEGYAIMVLNTNDNYIVDPGRKKKIMIRGSENAENHVLYVWDHIISRAKAKKIAFVAHSYGGLAVTELAIKRWTTSLPKRLRTVAFCDSIHSLHVQRANDAVINWFVKNSKNWATSNMELGKPIMPDMLEVPKVSAGTLTHEMTCTSSLNAIFEFLKEKMNE